MRVLVAYNDDSSLKSGLSEIEMVGEEEVAESAADVAAQLSQIHDCRLLPVGASLEDAIREIQSFAPAAVFNLCEGVLGRTEWESHFALLLEMLDIPFTGCSSIPLALCIDKGLIKRLLLSGGVPTPRGFVFEAGDPQQLRERSFAELDGPAFVKPARSDGGIGVDRDSFVRSWPEALERCRSIHQRYGQAALVEQFIDGRELNLAAFMSIDGLTMLPPGEIFFDDSLAAEERVVGFQAKWDSGSAEDKATVSGRAELDFAALKKVESVCRAASRLIGLDGYARFDVRVNSEGELFIVDVNPNPDISPGSGFRKSLEAAELPFSDFLNQLMMTSMRAKSDLAGSR
ncbi:MAG TPA: hypothetical protein VNM92_11730 [Thermoanaerobaculia bacterium]|nr:hypothetical protein [Thermoanaerobaculia bacterium]